MRIGDADPFFNEPTWTERMASAGGFIQLSACVNANADGVTCAPPNRQLFATGMNGDEDLGQDIIMKGKPFHYNQKLAQEAPEEGSAAEEKAEAKEDSKMAEAEAKGKKAEKESLKKKSKKSASLGAAVESLGGDELEAADGADAETGDAHPSNERWISPDEPEEIGAA